MDDDPTGVGPPIDGLIFTKHRAATRGAVRVMVVEHQHSGLGGQRHAASRYGAQERRKRGGRSSCIFASNLRPPLFLCPYLMPWQLTSMRSGRRTPSRPRKSSAFPSLIQAPE